VTAVTVKGVRLFIPVPDRIRLPFFFCDIPVLGKDVELSSKEGHVLLYPVAADSKINIVPLKGDARAKISSLHGVRILEGVSEHPGMGCPAPLLIDLLVTSLALPGTNVAFRTLTEENGWHEEETKGSKCDRDNELSN
jgi:hypothetical protein